MAKFAEFTFHAPDLAINPGIHRRTWGGSKSGPWKARNPVGIVLRYAKLRVFLPTSLPLCVAHLMARFVKRRYEEEPESLARRLRPLPVSGNVY
jgi:hypothetical protein